MRHSRRGNNAAIVGGLVIFIGLMAAYPVWYASRGTKVGLSHALCILHNQIINRSTHSTLLQVSTLDKAINADAAIRGAYVNSGSKDIGIDPKAGTYGRRSS